MERESGRVFSFGSLLIEFYGEQPPTIGGIMGMFYCTWFRIFPATSAVDQSSFTDVIPFKSWR